MRLSAGITAVVISFLLAAVAGPARSQSALSDTHLDTIAALSANAPTTMKLRDLDAAWRQFTLQSSSSDSFFSLYMMDGGGFGITDMGVPGRYYTQGHMVKVGRENYLVAYHVTLDPSNWNTISSGQGFGRYGGANQRIYTGAVPATNVVVTNVPSRY